MVLEIALIVIAASERQLTAESYGQGIWGGIYVG